MKLTKNKDIALKELENRRKINKNLKRVDNNELRAGSLMHFSPMYYYCLACGEKIVVPESYLGSIPNYCSNCYDLKLLGWLE